jgi:hypothetical protein
MATDKTAYVLIGFLSGFVFAFLWETATRRADHLAYQWGYHFHHSLFGLLAFLSIPLVRNDSNKTMFALGFGLGAILQHTLNEGFVFITKG